MLPVATVRLGPGFATGACTCAVMFTVLDGLEKYVSETTRCTSNLPVLSATNVGFAAVALLSVAVLPLGLLTSDH